MKASEACKSWGYPRRIAQKYQAHQANPWKVGLLFWVVITSIIGNALIIVEIFQRVF